MTVVNLCTSSGHALYLSQVSRNYLKRYQSYGADTNDDPLTDGRTDTQNFGGNNIIPRHFFVAGHKNYKRAYFHKYVGGVMVLTLYDLIMFYICTKFYEKFSMGFRVRAVIICFLKLSKA